MPPVTKSKTSGKSVAPAARPKVASRSPKAAKSAPDSKPPVTAFLKASGKGKGKVSAQAIDPVQRRHYVEVAAYYIAERRGFSEGNELDDWTQAELEIERLLNAGLLNT